MKKFSSILICFMLMMATVMTRVSTVIAHDVYVNSYGKKNGVHVEAHHRTWPNDTLSDNYSTKGNINPYTGKKGTVLHNPHSNSSSSYNHQKEFNPTR